MNAVVRSTARPTRRVLTVCAKFGLRVVSGPAAGERARIGRDGAVALDRALPWGGVALVTGPSGSGKTCLVRALASRLRGRGEVVVCAGAAGGVARGVMRGAGRSVARGSARRPARITSDRGVCRGAALHGRRAILDELADPCGGADRALGILARAGLADARLLARRANELSEGQRHRYALAHAIACAERAGGDRAPRGCTVIIDEFASSLDRTTARSLAATVRRWAGASPRVRVVCATAHDDVLEALSPDVLVYQSADGRAEVVARGGADTKLSRARECAGSR